MLKKESLMLKQVRLSICVFLILIMLGSFVSPGKVLAEAPQPPADPSAVEVPPDDLSWDTRFHVSGLNEQVRATVFDAAGVMYVGGDFTQAGSTPEVNHIAYWNGSTWLPLGRGVNDSVRALVMDGAGNIYVGGDFDQVDGQPVDRMAVYSTVTRTWSSLVDFPYSTDTVYSLALDAVHGQLYVGTSRRVVRYDLAAHTSSEWATATSREVYALAYDPASQILYAGGDFLSVGGVTARNIARYNGTVWQAMGAGFSTGAVRALAIDEASHLYAGGLFTAPGSRVAYWDGSAWSALGAGVPSSVYVLAYQAASRTLYVAGANTVNVSAWNANSLSWSKVGDTDTPSQVITSLQLYGAEIYIGGSFVNLGETLATRVAHWNGSAWLPMEAQTGLGVYSGAVTAISADNKGGVVIGGSFNRVGSIQHILGVARFNGTAWEKLGGSFDDETDSVAVDGDQIYAGGYFTLANQIWDPVTKTYTGGTSANHIARWDGTQWNALGTGLAGGVLRTIYPTGNGNLYAGGGFTTAGGATANRIAKWDGANWSPLMEGANNGISGGDVKALVQDPQGNLYIGGCFSQAGGKTIRALTVYRASDHTYQSLGTFNSGDCVYSLKFDIPTQKLYVGGKFASVTGLPVNSLAIYDPATATWAAITENGVSGVSGGVVVNNILIDTSGRIYITGDFHAVGNKSAGNIARWNGTSWDSLGTGLDDNGAGMALTSSGQLYVAGDFDLVGPDPSAHIALFQAGLGGPKLVSPADKQMYETMPKSLPLLWQAYPGAKGYEVQVFGYADYSLVKTFKTKKPVLSMTKKYLQPIDGPYYWRVRAMNGKVPLSGWSGLYQYWLPLKALNPAYPAPNAKMVERQPLFAWETARYPDSIKRYEFELYSSASLKGLLWKTNLNGGDAYRLPLTLAANKSYYWRVRFLASNGQYSLWSKTAKFTTVK
jgi:hypothetical protein